MAFITASDFPQLYAVVFGEGVLNDAPFSNFSPRKDEKNGTGSWTWQFFVTFLGWLSDPFKG